MSEFLAQQIGNLIHRVDILEREMALIKQYGLRAAFMVVLMLIGIALNVKASVMTDVVIGLLKRS